MSRLLSLLASLAPRHHGVETWNLSGTSPRMAIEPALPSFAVITLPGAGAAKWINSLVLASTSSSGQTTETPCLFGGTLSTTAGKKASTVRSSATKARTGRPSLSDRLTPSLITAGLIRGITPSLIRRLSGVPIRAFASLPLDGSAADEARVASSFSNVRPHEAPRHVPVWALIETDAYATQPEQTACWRCPAPLKHED